MASNRRDMMANKYPIYTTNNYYGGFERETTEEKMVYLMEQCRVQEKELDEIKQLVQDKEKVQAEEFSRIEHEKNMAEMDARHFAFQFREVDLENSALDRKCNQLTKKAINLEAENDMLNLRLDLMRKQLRCVRDQVDMLSEEKRGLPCLREYQTLKLRIDKIEAQVNWGKDKDGELLNRQSDGNLLVRITTVKDTPSTLPAAPKCKPEIPEGKGSTLANSDVATMTEEDLATLLHYQTDRANYLEARLYPEQGQCNGATDNQETSSKNGNTASGSDADEEDDQVVPS